MGATKAPAPELENYEYVRPLGAGGYADVFLYRDKRLGRDVAIKVLHEGQSDAEAKAMAAVSSHASIVEIYETATTSNGRAYIVMQFYPGPTFGERVKAGPLPIHEVLEVGVQLAGALSSAHQLGILHRDIKPANILTSEFNRAGLADFGIASDMSTPDEPTGVSLPWVPPEVLMGSGSDERSDVYALGATLFTLLEGRAPFVRPGRNNSDAAVMGRTLNDPIPEVQREDAPASFRSLLRSTLAREPERRPETAEQFGRALQAIEVELKLAQTPLDVKRPRIATPDRVGDDDATRGRSVRVITADPIPTGREAGDDRTNRGLIDAVPRAAAMAAAPVIARGRIPADVGDLPPVEDTRAPAGLVATGVAVSPPTGVHRWLLVLVGLAATLVTVVVVAALTGSSSGTPAPSGERAAVDTRPKLDASSPPIVKMNPPLRSQSTIVWTWAPVRSGDRYLVILTRDGQDPKPYGPDAKASFTQSGIPSDEQPSITVTVVRGDRYGHEGKPTSSGPVGGAGQ